MTRAVVVGGGFGGMAAAARLAKLGHEVTLLERSSGLGGALTTEHLDGFAWDAGPSSTLLPAVIRDLFRKSGRPLEREVDLVPLDLVREHRFEDGSRVRLPGGSRAAQLAAFDELGPGLGAAVGRPRGVVRRCVGGAAQGVVRATVRRRGRPPRADRPARRARVAAQAAAPGVLRRAAAARRRPRPGRWTATTCATCRCTPGSTSTSSSASAPGPSPAAWPRSAPRWPSASPPAASPC